MSHFKPQTKFTPQEAGRLISAQRLNEVFRYLDRDSQQLPDQENRPTWQVSGLFLAKITETAPSGGSLFTDCRYWIIPQLSVPLSSDGPDDKVHLQSDQNKSTPTKVVATSLAETVANTHGNFVDGDPVLVLQVLDSARGHTYPLVRNLIVSGGGSGGSLPTPQYQYMVVEATAQNQLGSDWIHFAAMV